MSEIREYIKQNLDENGKLSCKNAFKVSAKYKLTPLEVGNLAKEMGVRISECELGQFGNLDKSEYSDEAKEKLVPLMDEKRRITCKLARGAAQGIGLKKIRGTLKREKMDIMYCELGCFKEKKGKRVRVKTKTWLEGAEGELLFGKGKTEVLELIDKTGSIKGASEELGMNYKKTWSHIKILENNFDDVMVESKKGGSGSGGTILTPVARETIKKYRELQADIEEYANKRFKELFLKSKK